MNEYLTDNGITRQDVLDEFKVVLDNLDKVQADDVLSDAEKDDAFNFVLMIVGLAAMLGTDPREEIGMLISWVENQGDKALPNWHDEVTDLQTNIETALAERDGD